MKKILLIFCVLNWSFIFCQNDDTFIAIDGYNVINPKVETLVRFASWDLKMFNTYAKNLSQGSNPCYQDSGTENNCDWYGSGNKIKNAVSTIEKCSDGVLSITWIDFSKQTSMFATLVEDLQKYYKNTENGADHYYLKYDGVTYHFLISRNDGSEIVYVKKLE